jgi:hypothetical protein
MDRLEPTTRALLARVDAAERRVTELERLATDLARELDGWTRRLRGALADGAS